MAIFSSLLTLGSTKAVAASAAAVLIVGGGAAVADVTITDETVEPVEDEPAEDESAADESTDCPDAASTGLDIANAVGDEDRPGACPAAVEAEKSEESHDAPEDPEAEKGSDEGGDEADDEMSEEPAVDGDDQADAEAFSTWVESLDGDALGCLKGQLVSYFARQGPTNFEGPGPEIESADDALTELTDLHDGNYQSPGGCAERVLDEEPSDAAIEDLDDTEADRSSSETGPPANAGKPENVGKPQVDTQERPSPPAHAGSNGNGPGKSNAGEGKGGRD